jgi:acyl-CoA reductase-like NAD-dependent aldehyde dehydrogenase
MSLSLSRELTRPRLTGVKTLKYGDPSDPSVFIGPTINEKQLRGHLARIEGAQKDGA